MFKLQKIVWAVDPYIEVKSYYPKIAQILKLITKGYDTLVEPVHIFVPEKMYWSWEHFGYWYENIQLSLETELDDLMKELNLVGLEKPRIIELHGGTTRQAVERLILYARDAKADMIVVSTHAREGIAKYFMGSFAETLMLYSDVPVFIINPKVEVPEKYEEIIFPTDFSPNSRLMFESLLSFADHHQLKVILYHKLMDIMPLPPAGIFGGQGEGDYPVEYLEYIKKERNEDAKFWIAVADKRGIRTTAVLDEGNKNVAESIVNFSSGYPNSFIAMAAQAGPIATTLVGSNARQTIRMAHTPIWICHMHS